MFLQDVDSVLIITDTLATTPTGEPLIYQCKCWPLPQLGMVMTGTGSGNLAEAWYRNLQTRVLARDIEMLDRHAPEALRRLSAELEMEYGPLPGTSTIYHFGVTERAGTVVRFVYRSEKNFESEFSDQPGFGMKPPPASLPETGPDSLDGMVELAKTIRAEQDRLPADERVYIGGELFLTNLQGRVIGVTRVFRFGDYDTTWEVMNDRLAKQETDANA
jgi:hypothetical protein